MMSAETQIVLLRAAHTLIVALNGAGILYTIYCGVRGRFDRMLWAAVALSAGIAIGLAINGLICPLQTLARRITGIEGWAPDLFLPHWAAWLIAPVYGSLMAAGYGLVVWRLVQRGRAGPTGGKKL
jgi:hypothetical protein